VIIYRPSIEEKCRIVDNTITWSSTYEGFYYFYFLQLRLALVLTLQFYKEHDIEHAKQCFHIFNVVKSYSVYFKDERVGNTKINKYRYYALKLHYNRLAENIRKAIY
jgi:hypothetical protein